MKAKEMLDKVRNGNTIYIVGAYKIVAINQKCVERFKKAGYEVFKDDGDNFRLQQGKSSVYVFRNSVVLR